MRTVALAGLIIVGCCASSALSQQSPTPLVPNPPDTQEQTLVPRGSEKPSFDCAQAKTAAARLICADEELARLDGELGAAFQKRKGQISAPDQSQFSAAQLAWIRDRNERCALVGKNGATVEQLMVAKPCMMSLMRERIAFLAQTSNARADTATPPQVAFSNQGETYEQDKIWGDRIEHGACTRLRDRRTDSQADIAECNRDYAMTPMCISYKGFALAWYDMANDPNPALSNPAFAMANLNDLGSKGDSTDPPYYHSPQFRELLRRLLNLTFSSARNKWSTRDQFADFAYKICMEGHPFGLADVSQDQPQQPVPEQPRNGVVSNAPKGIVPAIDNVLAAALADCDSQAREQVKRDDANWTIGPHWPRQFDSLWTQHVNEIEQQRQQCRRYAEATAAQRAQGARNQERDRERGYEPISVETFVLDSKELAAKAAKVSVSGAYLGQNNIGFVYVDTRAVIMATKYPNLGEQPKVPLLTDNATREFRQRLLACQSNPAAAQVGCPLTILGEVTICTFSNGLGAERTSPCINVEDGR